MTTNPTVPEDLPTEAELETQHYERTIRELKERLAMRNAAAVLYGTHLERLLEAVEADNVTPRIVAGARKALGMSYDADDLEEYGDDGRCF